MGSGSSTGSGTSSSMGRSGAVDQQKLDLAVQVYKDCLQR
jgi:hypothetical protein